MFLLSDEFYLDRLANITRPHADYKYRFERRLLNRIIPLNFKKNN